MSSAYKTDNRYWYENTDSTVSEWVNLTEGEEYYFEVNHYTDGWGSDHMAVAVEIEDSGFVGHHHTMKEVQMVKIGTRIIQDQTGTETDEAAKIRFSGQNSKLGSIITNVETAFNKCFMWAMEFMGGTAEPSIYVNREFYDASVDPQLLMAQIQLMDRGVIAQSDIRHLMRKANLIDSERTDEMIDDEAESDNMLFDEMPQEA